MEVLKFIGAFLLAALSIGIIIVRYALRNGMHVPTNSEIINGTKAVIEARRNPKKDTTVKANQIRKLN